MNEILIDKARINLKKTSKKLQVKLKHSYITYLIDKILALFHTYLLIINFDFLTVGIWR